MNTEALAIDLDAIFVTMVAKVEAIEAFLTDPAAGKDQYVVCQRVLRSDNSYGSLAPMRKVAGGYNFSAQTPDEMFKTGFDTARYNCEHFARSAYNRRDNDLDYLVRGVRYVAEQQLEALKGAVEMLRTR